MKRLPALPRIRILQIASAAIVLLVMFSLASPFIARAVPAKPVLLSPANFSTITVAGASPQAVPVFHWQLVSGATQYQFQIADNIGFSGGIAYDVGGIQSNNYIPPPDGNLTDKVWYWRVRAYDVSGWGFWSDPWQFTRSWSTSNAAALSAPAANATIEFFEDPVFSWFAAVGASAYELKVGQDPACQTSPNSINITTLATHYTPVTRLFDGNYYWWVVPLDANNHEGNPGECRHVIVAYAQSATLLSPADGSTPTYTPKFQWTAVKGAFAYDLYYGTTSNFQNGTFTKVTVYATAYTPDQSLPNDQTTWWKVTPVYGGNWEGPASSIWSFQKHWYQKPVILTPHNNELTNPTLFSWTPVRETWYYIIEASYDPGFNGLKWSAQTPNTYYWRNQWDPDEWGKTEYLRVRPYDRNQNSGQNSIQVSFRPTYTLALVENLYPRYYYSPPFITSTLAYTIPYNIPVSYDYTTDTPNFYWSRTFVPGLGPDRIEADHYLLEVNKDPNFLLSDDWSYTTQNLSATPTDGAPFTPTVGTDYYWRVTPYDQFGILLPGTATNQPWKTQIDTTRLAAAVISVSPPLLRPAFGEVVVDTLPSFEWLPQSGAAHYRFAISSNSAVTPTVYFTTTKFTHHTPSIRLPKGTYYWQVCGLDGSGTVVGSCTTAQRLIVAYETRWNYPAALLPQQPGTLIGTSPNSGLGSTELTNMYVAQTTDNWLIGFNVNSVLTGTVWYGIYINGNQADNSGAPTAPVNRPHITTSSYYQPQYALYVVYSNTQFITNYVALHDWNFAQYGGDGWDPQIRNLVDSNQVGGSITYDSAQHYVELKIPKTAIGDGGSAPYMLSASMFSVLGNNAVFNTAAVVSDTVPDNGQGVSQLTEFKTIGDRVNLSLPGADLANGNAAALPNTPYMYAETGNIDYLKGFKVELALDPSFTTIVDTQDSVCVGCYLYPDIFPMIYSPQYVSIDKSLYWRYTIKHAINDNGTIAYSPPSLPHTFTKAGPTPANLQALGAYGMPTFQWDPVETAGQYELRISTNPLFSPVGYDRTVNHENFTPNDFNAVPGQTYYWQVRAINDYNRGYQSAWSITSTIQITYPKLTTLLPASNSLIHATPQFHWQPIFTPTFQPAWGSFRYHLQVATTSNGFGSLFEDVGLDTTNWTPNRSYADGTYYWRVAVRDANNNDGPFSPVYSFTKQYPFVTILSPLSGANTGSFPVFSWIPITGAAHYQIQTGTDPQYSNQIEFQTTDNAIYIPTAAYQPAAIYWRVRMMDHDNNPGPWTDSTIAVNPYPYRLYLPLVER